MHISAEFIRKTALENGFTLVGTTDIEKTDFETEARAYIDESRHANMDWMKKNMDARIRPSERYINFKSAIMLATNYYSEPLPRELSENPNRGIIARYAWFKDYHTIIKKRLRAFENAVQTFNPNIHTISYVDTGPIFEKEWAKRAGIGFIGKNGLCINRHSGSFMFLSEILIDTDTERIPIGKQYGQCGACEQCMNACPTGALVKPYTLDSNLCISYLTIEHRGIIDPSLHEKIGNRLFGCDMCQDICPWNKKARITNDPAFKPRTEQQAPLLVDALKMSQTQFNEQYAGTAIRRATYEGFLRNAIIALGNGNVKTAKVKLPPFLKSESLLLRETAHDVLNRI